MHRTLKAADIAAGGARRRPSSRLASTSSGATTTRSARHRRSLSFDRDLDQIRPISRHGALHDRGNVAGLFDPDAFDAHAGRQMHKIEVRSRQVHLLIGMLRARFEILTPDVHIVLEDAILPV